MSNNITVESGIPIPENRRRNKYPWHSMKAGDSFFIEEKDAAKRRKMVISIKGAAARHFKTEVRSSEDGVRVWRVE